MVSDREVQEHQELADAFRGKSGGRPTGEARVTSYRETPTLDELLTKPLSLVAHPLFLETWDRVNPKAFTKPKEIPEAHWPFDRLRRRCVMLP